jgi:methionyl-tRNA formyltransferase
LVNPSGQSASPASDPDDTFDRMSVVYVSSLQTGRECLERIRRHLTIDHIVTIDRSTAERARVSGYAEFNDLSIPVLYLERYAMNGPRDLARIAGLAPRLIIVNGWNRLIPPAVLALPPAGCVGFHGSGQPLPLGRGRSPITWAILNDAERFFLHLLYLDEGIDSGDIIDTAVCDVTCDEYSFTLLSKVAGMTADLLLRNMPRLLDGTAPRTPQTGVPTYLPRRTAEGGRIDWAMSRREICRLVRAVSRPFPGAFAVLEYRGAPVTMRIWEAAAGADTSGPAGPVGTVLREADGHPVIQCRDGTLVVRDFELAAAS